MRGTLGGGEAPALGTSSWADELVQGHGTLGGAWITASPLMLDRMMYAETSAYVAASLLLIGLSPQPASAEMNGNGLDRLIIEGGHG
ncbi:hypothetical protein [Mesorhizobium sp. WSM2239]|uniref:Uncharacterized protein n=2 Tax=unclassified Mesorhizobium TaxID=325217 RepID=A0AAU8D812_9HYPH